MCAAIAARIKAAKRILAVTHANPDGDALGSLAAMGHIAVSLGIDTRLFCESPLPDHLAWLPLPAPLARTTADLTAWRPDLVVFLDCADEQRAGQQMEDFIKACRAAGGIPRPDGDVCASTELMCIDHHVGNPLFADHNWVNPASCATGAMVADLALELGLPLSGQLGEAVYLALSSDTGSFTYANTTAQALDLAALIVKEGLSIANFTEKYENNWSLARMHLWGALMREVSLHCGGAAAMSVVTQETLDRFGAERTDLENYASWLRRIKGVRVVILVRVSANGSKVSLRSMGDVDVREIAAMFGGGGHMAAAGADMPMPPAEAAESILDAVHTVLGFPRYA